MFEVTVERKSQAVLTECQRRGLIVKMEGFLRTKNGRHWHLGFPGQPGVLEVTELGRRTSLTVASNRDGGWATSMARDLEKKFSGRSRSH